MGLTYEERLAAYEREKYHIAFTCKDQKDYEKRIKALAKKYRI